MLSKNRSVNKMEYEVGRRASCFLRKFVFSSELKLTYVTPPSFQTHTAQVHEDHLAKSFKSF